MKKWMQNVAAVLKKMGVSSEKIAANSLSAEEWKQVEEAYQKEYGKTLAEDKEAGEDADPDPDNGHEAEATALADEERAAIAGLLGVNPSDVPANAAEAARKAAEAAAQAQQAAGGAQGFDPNAAGGAQGGASGNGSYYDADYEVVDDDNKDNK